ncbi:hypothetical protein CK203_098758 [Vitis vinifera]|uniref:Uncharacterized protein n=1 Tax=Vitis vinifera TaxID=29760 RepID=A0A438EGE5_VITVI|nr:hypothetical protein CK203_098758 [Vitis vinifera]
MAPSAVLSFLFILVLFSSPRFKLERAIYAPTPAPAPGPASELFQSDTLDGYGLYGRGSNEFSPATVSENEVVPEELTDESYKELAETSYSNNNNRYSLNTTKTMATRLSNKG